MSDAVLQSLVALSLTLSAPPTDMGTQAAGARQTYAPRLEREIARAREEGLRKFLG